MSDYQDFIAEREQIDFLIEQGYQIKSVTENLSGAFVDFELVTPDPNGYKEPIERLHLLTADARKYFSSLIIAQKKLS
ncbi:hypothetical protein [Halalkalibacter akibai]|uniref:Uncharacterized protein n=1 Tax=Halalkalibacter akibai (strain ATCC 43226 / DSM 21942 / CIP 109018 / JCM 9157 / 1139) TaxID=1236973 RepID=W4QT11_HALA3|nr:hypothetical protein [Halalkalibacter akibai]GAE35241.1 hypothetical protein JCM9157_2340 [Halalkalibacter akibai JCM 9157]